MMAYISRLAQLKKIIKEHPWSIIITERSIFTDRNVFAKMLYDNKKNRKRLTIKYTYHGLIALLRIYN